MINSEIGPLIAEATLLAKRNATLSIYQHFSDCCLFFDPTSKGPVGFVLQVLDLVFLGKVSSIFYLPGDKFSANFIENFLSYTCLRKVCLIGISIEK